jgi:PAS domain S-box-containing protein
MRDHAIVIADVDGIIHQWSPGAEKLFGFDAGEAIGRSLDLIVPENLRPRHWAGFRHAIDSGSSKIDGALTKLPVLCKSGEVIVFPARLTFLRDERDRPLGVMTIYGPRQDAGSPG